jgi:hypothetical protein
MGVRNAQVSAHTPGQIFVIAERLDVDAAPPGRVSLGIV